MNVGTKKASATGVVSQRFWHLPFSHPPHFLTRAPLTSPAAMTAEVMSPALQEGVSKTVSYAAA
jgi:hypothetical protein